MPSKTESEPLLAFAVTTSRLPSPFRSPNAIPSGAFPVPNSLCVPNVPSPFPMKIETSSTLLHASARSSLPSVLKSAIATEVGVFEVT